MSESEVKEAVRTFYPDYQKLRRMTEELEELMKLSGRSSSYDDPLRKTIARQEELIIQMRQIFAEIYELLSPAEQEEIGRWILGSVKRVREYRQTLGIAPAVIIIGGVVIAAATATALVAWHRAISVQEKAIEYQRTLIPLVAKGDLPPEVLKPIKAPGGGLLEMLPTLAVVGLVLYGFSVVRGK